MRIVMRASSLQVHRDGRLVFYLVADHQRGARDAHLIADRAGLLHLDNDMEIALFRAPGAVG